MNRKILCDFREVVSSNFIESVSEYCEAYKLSLHDELIILCNGIVASANQSIFEGCDDDE